MVAKGKTLSLFDEIPTAPCGSEEGSCAAGKLYLLEARGGRKRGRVARGVSRRIAYCGGLQAATWTAARHDFDRKLAEREPDTDLLPGLEHDWPPTPECPAPQRPSSLRLVKQSQCVKGACMHFRRGAN